ITFVNPRMAEMLGYQPAEMLGRAIWDFLFEEDEEALRTMFGRRRAGISEQADVRFRHKDRREVWTILCARPVKDHQGQFRGALDLFTDVTQRKHAEDALREADQRKNEFLAMLAHELRNPLAAISSAACLSRQPQLCEQDRRWSQDVIERQV